MKHEIPIGISVETVTHGHEPTTYVFHANSIINIVGGYGVCGGYNKRAFITVDLPDRIVKSEKWEWPLSLPGRKSTSGTEDLCFVICGETVSQECQYYGGIDAEKLILKALSTGVFLVYPDKDGKMQRKQIPYTLERWLDW